MARKLAESIEVTTTIEHGPTYFSVSDASSVGGRDRGLAPRVVRGARGLCSERRVLCVGTTKTRLETDGLEHEFPSEKGTVRLLRVRRLAPLMLRSRWRRADHYEHDV